MPVLLLEDHSLEIPPFLQRLPDGPLKYMGLAVPEMPPAASTTVPSDSGDYRAVTGALTPHDLEVIEQLKRDQDLHRIETAQDRAREARERRKEQQEQIAQRTVAARRNFLKQGFKWEWEK